MDDLGALLVQNALERIPDFDKKEIEDLYCGCAMPEGEQGMNVGRIIALLARLPQEVSACTYNRFCASSLSAIMESSKSVMVGHGDAFVAVGIETMTNVPMGGFNVDMNPKLTEKECKKHDLPWAYVPMGITAENVAKKYEVSREAQDEFAYESNMKAAKAIKEGWFKDEIVPVELPNGEVFDTDEGPRPDTTKEVLGKLKPAFVQGGTVTAGNSSQLSDGAACCVVMSRKKAESLGIKDMWRVVSFGTAGVHPEYMGMGPVPATKKALGRADMKLDDMDAVELNEAFASQSVAVLGELGANREKVNQHGGAIALGHPLGCSGARIVVTLIGVLNRIGGKRGLATMCVGGGMGGALIIEKV
jgi:acetyl-CoA acetyltransferase family protein